MSRIIAWTFILTLNLNGVAWASSGLQSNVPNSKEYEQAQQVLDEYWKLIAKLRLAIDRSQFDIDALLEELSFDAEEIVSYVREQIYFEQYPGVLRGAEGTLMSRAGNALDQSILLNRLLNDAGYEARIVQATLSHEQSSQLLMGLLDPRSPEPPVGDAEQINSVLSEMAVLAGIAHPQSASDIFDHERVAPLNAQHLNLMRRETDRLLKLIGSAQLGAGSVGQRESLITELQDYYYTEYRTSPTAGWKPVHPIDTRQRAGSWTFSAKKYLQNSVPKELQHRIKIQAFAEQRLGSKKQTQALFEPWVRPTANLNGRTITYTNVPNNFEDLKDQPTASTWEASNIFGPVLNGQLPPKARLFDTNGNTIDPVAGSSPAAGVFQTVGDRFGRAAGLLNGDGDAADYVSLTDLWLEITLIDPLGKERVFKRSIVHHSDAMSSSHVGLTSTAKLVRMLTAKYSFMLATGELPNAFVFDSMLEKISSLRIPVEIALAQRYSKTLPTFAKTDWEGVDMAWSGHASMYKMFDRVLSDTNSRQYRHEPSVLIHSQELPLWNGPSQSIDIVTNSRRSVSAGSDGWQVDPKELLRRGVWETVTERSFLPPEIAQVNTLSIFDKARSHGIEIKTLRPGSVDQLAKLDLPQISIRAIRADLDGGFSVVVPERLPENESVAGWWRVNVNTGETLGMIGDGRGSAAERVIFKVIAGVLLVVVGTSLCMTGVYSIDASADNLFNCAGIATAAVMMPYSAVLGFILGTTISLLDILVDIAPQEPNPCPPNSICNPP